MQEAQKFVGVDGCRFGWIAVVIQGQEITCSIYKHWQDLWITHQDYQTMLVDIPIGLTDVNFERSIEPLMRRVLERRKSSVFTPPARPSLSESNYKNALKINRNVVGKGISIQSFNIASKIKELDEFLKNGHHERLFEAHPEICFHFLNHSKTPLHSKKTKQGIEERISILKLYQAKIEGYFKHFNKQIQRQFASPDDIVDALCLALTAFLANGELKFISQGQIDRHHLPIQIGYYDPKR